MSLPCLKDKTAEIGILRDDQPIFLFRPTQDCCIAQMRIHVTGEGRVIPGLNQRASDTAPDVLIHQEP